jgi:phenylpyruvate tautomerase
MPLLKLQLSECIDDEKKKILLSCLSRIVSDSLGKPEKYIMIILEQGSFFMLGSEDPAAFADVRSIGSINSRTTLDLTQKLCRYLDELLGIPSNRVYITFTDIPAENWGWNGEIFG